MTKPVPPRDGSYREAQRYDRERRDYLATRRQVVSDLEASVSALSRAWVAIDNPGSPEAEDIKAAADSIREILYHHYEVK